MPHFRVNGTGNNATISERVSQKLTFFGMVGVVMTALHLTDRWDDYKQVPSEEDGLNGTGRVALHSPTGFRGEDDDDDITLHAANIDTEIPDTSRPKRKRSKNCCMCCGINCGLFWKAFGIVLGIFFVWNMFKVIKWAVTPSLTGLEDLPAFSTSLGCVDAPYIKDSVNTTYTVSPGHNYEHELEIRGIALGTITIAQGASDATEIQYESTLRTNDKAVVDMFSVTSPFSDGQTISSSYLRISTSSAVASESTCMRYDIVVYVPSNLKKLDIKTHSATHLQFDPESQIALEDLSITLSALTSDNILKLHDNIHATRLSLEVRRGWVTGDVSVVDTTTINTQRGDTVTNVHVYPAGLATSDDTFGPATARFETTTGTGRTDVFYVSGKAFPHRLIDNTHITSQNGDLYLTYSEAEFNGHIDIHAKSYTTRGMQGRPGLPVDGDNRPWAGDKNGGDKLTIKSPTGWVGLYF